MNIDNEPTERERHARRLLIMKRVLEVLGWLTAVALFAFASHAVFAQQGQVTVTVRPPQSPEERVTDEFKEKRLRETAEEEFAKEQAAKLADKSPRALLARARTLYVRSGTSYFEPVQLQNELRKRDEFEAWGLLIFDEYKKSEVADLLIEVDRPLFTFTFTYKVTDRATGVLLASGKVTAFDGNSAAPDLARRIIKDMRAARGETHDKKK
jgi:cell division protein FtsB